MFVINNLNFFNRSKGVTLLEWMIAMFLSMILASTALTLYITHQKKFYLQQAILHIADHAERALEILTTEIHAAGHAGCAKLAEELPSVPRQKLREMTMAVVAGDHTLAVQHASNHHAELISSMLNFTTLVANDAVQFKQNDLLIVSDCHRAAIFQVDTMSRSQHIQTMTTLKPLHAQFMRHAELSRFEVNRFYVSHASLMVEDRQHHKMRLVDGIDQINFHVLYHALQPTMIAIQLEASEGEIHKTWYADVAL